MYQSCFRNKRKAPDLGVSFFLLLSLPAFLFYTKAECVFGKKTGITGYVQRVSGNQMPSVDQPPAAPKGIQTTLYIYELTHTSQVAQVGITAFYSSIQTKLIKKVETKGDGSFTVKLKPGMYSLFVKKDSLFYANIFDGNNNIYPVKVEKNKMTAVNFKADYGAVY